MRGGRLTRNTRAYIYIYTHIMLDIVIDMQDFLEAKHLQGQVVGLEPSMVRLIWEGPAGLSPELSPIVAVAHSSLPLQLSQLVSVQLEAADGTEIRVSLSPFQPLLPHNAPPPGRDPYRVEKIGSERGAVAWSGPPAPRVWQLHLGPSRVSNAAEAAWRLPPARGHRKHALISKTINKEL